MGTFIYGLAAGQTVHYGLKTQGKRAAFKSEPAANPTTLADFVDVLLPNRNLSLVC
jgi:hypothetical protein